MARCFAKPLSELPMLFALPVRGARRYLLPCSLLPHISRGFLHFPGLHLLHPAPRTLLQKLTFPRRMFEQILLGRATAWTKRHENRALQTAEDKDRPHRLRQHSSWVGTLPRYLLLFLGLPWRCGLKETLLRLQTPAPPQKILPIRL